MEFEGPGFVATDSKCYKTNIHASRATEQPRMACVSQWTAERENTLLLCRHVAAGARALYRKLAPHGRLNFDKHLDGRNPLFVVMFEGSAQH